MNRSTSSTARKPSEQPEAGQRVFGVGLIPLGPGGDDRARAILLLRSKDGSGESAFQAQLLLDAKSLAVSLT